MMKNTFFVLLCLVCLSVFPNTLIAHQPVIDMAPRWEDGYGFQTRLEHQDHSRLVSNGAEIANPLGLKDETTTLWLEGIYSFTREHRISFK